MESWKDLPEYDYLDHDVPDGASEAHEDIDH